MSLGLLLRRLRQIPGDGELTLPESSALVRLDRGGSATAAELARQEQISPQSMGATLAALEGRGLVGRVPDPADGRRVIISITAAGRRVLNNRRNARVEQMARALSADFTRGRARAAAGGGTSAGATGPQHLMGADRYRWIALSNTTMAVFMSALDGSIVIIALPAIFRGIHLDPLAPGNISYLLWMIMGYRLVRRAAWSRAAGSAT